MGIFTTIGDAIWARLEPMIDQKLDELQVVALRELEQWRAEAMDMLAEAMPEMAGAIAEQAVKTTFEHTQVDEAADAVSGVITDIVGRLPRFPFLRP